MGPVSFSTFITENTSGVKPSRPPPEKSLKKDCRTVVNLSLVLRLERLFRVVCSVYFPGVKSFFYDRGTSDFNGRLEGKRVVSHL